MKHSNKFFFLILFSIFILIPICSLPLDVSARDATQYISATDILKNFTFESIGDETIVSGGAFDNKLRFDTQMEWILYKDDVTALNYIEDEGDTYLKYRVVLRNKINMYTNVRINQMAQSMYEVKDTYLGMTYTHLGIDGGTSEYWQKYITWEHWEFGDIKNWNYQNNYFNGRIKMSFDIDDNPVPNTFGDYTDKNFDYIAVESAGIVTNTYGLMSDDMPDIIVLTQSEEESEVKDSATSFDFGNLEHDDKDYRSIIDPNVVVTVGSEPTESYDSSILPDTAGSSMDPETKAGGVLWDPENEQSMTGCNIYYDLSALSPVVYKYTGALSYTEYDLETQHEYTENFWDAWATFVDEKHFYAWSTVKYGDVALHGINRYIQVDMIVAFVIWTSVTLGTLTEYYEQMQLSAPSEYYDALIWSTLAGGWKGSTIGEGGDPGIDIFGDLFDFLDGIGGIITLILVIAIAGIGIYIFFVFVMPLVRRKRKLKSK